MISAKSRANFGNGFLSLRPSYWRLRPGPARGTFGTDYDWSYVDSNGNRLARVVLGGSYLQALTGDGSDRPPTQAYFSVSAGLAPTSIRSQLSQERSGTRVGLQGTVLIGYLYKMRINFRASYTAASRIAGFDLSSYSIGGDYKF